MELKFELLADLVRALVVDLKLLFCSNQGEVLRSGAGEERCESGEAVDPNKPSLTGFRNLVKARHKI